MFVSNVFDFSPKDQFQIHVKFTGSILSFEHRDRKSLRPHLLASTQLDLERILSDAESSTKDIGGKKKNKSSCASPSEKIHFE